MSGSPVTAAAPAIEGIRLGAVAAGIRYADRLDLVLVELSSASRVAAVFTQNAFCAAPVHICRQHLAERAPRYLVINTGNANAGTGQAGLTDALSVCQALAGLAGVPTQSVLPFSTGVIGEPLPVEAIRQGLPGALSSLSADGWASAAEGILTTDTRSKLVSKSVSLGGVELRITGMAKGAGMIKPNMATMLAFVATDADLQPAVLDSMLRQCVGQSFNRITVDGDTSTNDACLLIATGASGVDPAAHPEHREAFLGALRELFVELATSIIRDAEGGSKFVTIRVSGARSSEDCLKVAYAIAESPLVKTALFASDANWGRILAAVGRAGVAGMQIDAVSIDLGELALVRDGGFAAGYLDADGQRVMERPEIELHIDLGMGSAQETVWTSDLSHDYVRINAEYRS